jgi:hypothetical protein
MAALFHGRFYSMMVVAVALSCSAFVPTVAHAQRAVILPVAGRQDLVAQYGDEAVATMRTVLESASLEPISTSDAQTAMVRAGTSPCEQPACVPDMLRTLDAVMGAGVAIWPHEVGIQVAVVLVDPEGRQANGARELPLGASVRDSVVEATDAALASWAVRSGAAVRVTGSPAGASITVDRVLWGTIPHEGTLSPGEHRFVVSAVGHETERRTVPIQVRVDGNAEELNFALRPSEGSSDSSGNGEDHLALGLGIGVPAIVAGLALVVTGAVLEAEGVQCASESCDPSLPLDERFVSSPATGQNVAFMISGSVLVIAGGIVMGVLGSSGSSSGQSARRWTDGTRIFF